MQSFRGYIGSRLERKLALLLSLVALISLLILTLLAVRTITVTRQRNVAELEWQLTNQTVDRLRKFIDDKIESFRIVVADPNVTAIGYEQQTFILQGHLKNDASLVELSFVQPADGAESARVVRGKGEPVPLMLDTDGSAKLCVKETKNFNVGAVIVLRDTLSGPFTAALQSVGVACPGGQELVLSAAPPAGEYAVAESAAVTENPEHRVFKLTDPAVAAALKGENYFGPVYFVGGEPRIVLASPVVNQQGTIIGVLRGEANLTAVAPLVAQANLGASGYLYVLDQEGYAMASSSNISSRLEVGSRLTATPLSPSMSEAERYKSSVTREPSFGVKRAIPKFGWTVVTEWPEGEAMAVVGQVVARLMVGAALLLILTIFLSVVLARRFARPLRELKSASEQVGQGRFDISLPTAGKDEVGDLARSFGEMTKGLKELERLKDEFVFIAAHELRTPVTAIRGYAEMLTDSSKDLSDQTKEFVLRLQQSGERLATLVNDLLEVARSQAGRLKVQTSPQDIVSVVQAILAELKPLVDQKHHTVSFNPETVPLVLADKDKLQEVLVNLIGNAVKYTPEGGQVQVAVVSQPAGFVTCSVRDNGIGISPEDQAKLFQRFFRVESDETRNIQGTGLGLFIVRQIVEHMGGAIWVTSEKGKGSTFSFKLPVAA